MTQSTMLLLLVAGLAVTAAGQDKPADIKRPYKDDPAVIKQLVKMGDNTAAWLEGMKGDQT